MLLRELLRRERLVFARVLGGGAPPAVEVFAVEERRETFRRGGRACGSDTDACGGMWDAPVAPSAPPRCHQKSRDWGRSHEASWGTSRRPTSQSVLALVVESGAGCEVSAM